MIPLSVKKLEQGLKGYPILCFAYYGRKGIKDLLKAK